MRVRLHGINGEIYEIWIPEGHLELLGEWLKAMFTDHFKIRQSRVPLQFRLEVC